MSAHLKQFLMEASVDVETLGGKIPAQHIAEASRAAKPYAGISPIWYGLMNLFAGEQAVSCIDRDMHIDTSRLGIG